MVNRCFDFRLKATDGLQLTATSACTASIAATMARRVADQYVAAAVDATFGFCF
jgi:hypothetical protein